MDIVDLANRDVLDLLATCIVKQDILDSIGSTRTHDAFLNSYGSEDEGLYDDC